MNTKKILSAFAAVLATTAFAVNVRSSHPERWSNADLGICITSVVCEASGVTVAFRTDVPPPYRVGVHIPYEVGFNTRAQPVNFVDTSETHAFIPCDLYDAAVFVQVYKKDNYITPSWTRKRTAREWDVYVASLLRHPIRTITDQSWYTDPPDMSPRGMDPSYLTLVGDHTWGGFVYTDQTALDVDVELVSGGSTNVYHGAISGRDPAVGTGFRVLAFDDAGSCQLYAAYSAKTNMSQEVLIKRGWKSLSSNGAWKIATDWEGSPVMVPCTNAVPYRMYGEGL